MKPQKIAQDISANQAKAAVADASSGLKVEIENNIPIKSPNQAEPTKDPRNPAVAPAKQFVEVGGSAGDKELDKILKDASSGVKDLAKTPAAKHNFSLKRLIAKKTKQQKDVAAAAPSRSKKPALTVIIAFIIGAGLATAAVYAFRPSPAAKSPTAPATMSTVGTSSTSSDAIQAAGGTLIKPGDISDFTAVLQTKIDQLNDAQDFNSQDLSDQNLGL